MRHVMQVVDGLRDLYADNELLHWLTVTDDNIRPEQKIWGGLFGTGFILGFRDLNIYHISYRDPGNRNRADATQDSQRHALSTHAAEDMTHAKLFLRDFTTLGWDDLLPWRPSEVLYWIYGSAPMEGMRRRTAGLARIMIEAGDPALRYAAVESVEASGCALLTAFADVARRHAAATGQQLYYWGEYHLARETGHTMIDENVFADLKLSPNQRTAAVRGAIRVYHLLDEQHNEYLRLGQQALSCGGFDQLRTQCRPPGVRTAPTMPESIRRLLHPTDPHPTQRGIEQAVRRLEANALAAAGPPTAGPNAPALLRTATLLLGPDAAAEPMLYRYHLPYPAPADAAQRAINRLAASLTPATPTFYTDWITLGLDDTLAWPPSQLLRVLYLGRNTEPSRALHALIRGLLADPDPIMRYWTVAAWKRLSAAHRHHLSTQARAIASDLEPLPFLIGGAGYSRRESDPDPQAEAIHFARQPISPDTAQRAVQFVDRIDRAIQHQTDMITTEAENQTPLQSCH